MNTATCVRAAAVASLVWSWSATSAVAQDRLHVADGDVGPAPQQAGAIGGALLVKLDTLETGIGLRDHHMRDNYLEVGKGAGYDVATIENIQVDKTDGKGTFKATLLLHGQKRQMAGTSIVHRRGDGTTHVDAEFPLKVSEFEIPKPTYLGVGVRDEIRVKVAFN